MAGGIFEEYEVLDEIKRIVDIDVTVIVEGEKPKRVKLHGVKRRDVQKVIAVITTANSANVSSALAAKVSEIERSENDILEREAILKRKEKEVESAMADLTEANRIVAETRFQMDILQNRMKRMEEENRALRLASRVAAPASERMPQNISRIPQQQRQTELIDRVLDGPAIPLQSVSLADRAKDVEAGIARDLARNKKDQKLEID